MDLGSSPHADVAQAIETNDSTDKGPLSQSSNPLHLLSDTVLEMASQMKTVGDDDEGGNTPKIEEIDNVTETIGPVIDLDANRSNCVMHDNSKGEIACIEILSALF